MPPSEPPDDPGQRATRQLNPEDFTAMAIAVAALERLGSWQVYAFRLGTLALLQQSVRALAQPDATHAEAARAAELVAALRQMPLEH